MYGQVAVYAGREHSHSRPIRTVCDAPAAAVAAELELRCTDEKVEFRLRTRRIRVGCLALRLHDLPHGSKQHDGLGFERASVEELPSPPHPEEIRKTCASQHEGLSEEP